MVTNAAARALIDQELANPRVTTPEELVEALHAAWIATGDGKNWTGKHFKDLEKIIAKRDEAFLNTITLLREEKERASDLIKRLADDVEAEVKATYDRKLDFPDMRRRFDRDMAIVHEARALLSASTIPGAKAEETASAERCQAEFERYCLEAESWPEISVVKNPDGSYVVVDTQHCYHWWEAAFHTALSLRTKEQP